MEFYLDPWKKFATFDGRSRRKEYWTFVLINGAINVLLSMLPSVVGTVGWILIGAFALAMIVPTLAVVVRRLHDIGKSGWWMCINFVPAIGGIWFLILMCTNSQAGSNQWGECPK